IVPRLVCPAKMLAPASGCPVIASTTDPESVAVSCAEATVHPAANRRRSARMHAARCGLLSLMVDHPELFLHTQTPPPTRNRHKERDRPKRCKPFIDDRAPARTTPGRYAPPPR